MKHTDEIVIDIETIPSLAPWVRGDAEKSCKPPANTKKQESIDKWYKEKHAGAVEEKLAKGGLDAATGHVICIGYAVNDEPAQDLLCEDVADEKTMLSNFINVVSKLNAPTYIGFNITGFDIKFIRQRCMILGVDYRGLPWQAKPWDLNPFDCMTQWDAKNFISLDKLAKAFGLEGKPDGMDGSQVWEYYQDKRFKEISDYCRDDVELTRNVYRKMRRI